MVLKKVNEFAEFLNEGYLLFKDSSMIFAANILGSLVLFVANILLAKQFNPDAFGTFKTVVNFALLVPSLIELGAGITLTKYLAEFSKTRPELQNHIVSFFIRLRIVCFLLSMAILLLMSGFFSNLFFKDASYQILLVAGVFIVGASFFDIYRSIITGFQKFKILAWAEFLQLALIGVFTFVFAYFGGLFWAIIGWGLGILIGMLPAVLATRHELKKHKTQSFDIRPIFWSYSIPMFLMIIPNFLALAIIPILSLFYSQTIVGYYGFAMIFYNGIILFPNALYQVLLPQMSQMHGRKEHDSAKQILRKSMEVYAAIAVVGIVAVLLFSEPLIQLLAPKYLPGLLVFQSINILCFLLGFFRILQSYYSAVNKIKEVALVITLQTILIFVVSIAVVSWI